MLCYSTLSRLAICTLKSLVQLFPQDRLGPCGKALLTECFGSSIDGLGFGQGRPQHITKIQSAHGIVSINELGQSRQMAELVHGEGLTVARREASAEPLS